MRASQRGDVATELALEVIRIAARFGFDVGLEYATPEELTAGIREFPDLEPGRRLTDLQRRALLQNLAGVISVTCGSGHTDSVRRQSRLHRFRFLRVADPRAARAYAEVLGYLGIEVPNYLLEDA